jgi:malonate transporter and related proteins
MWSVLLVTFPFFALVLCGFLAAHRGMLPLQAIPGLNGFVLFFALPCLLFRFGASTPIAQLLSPGSFLTYLACALVMVAFTVAVTLSPRVGWKDASFGALVAAFPNSGFMGVPLLVALLGPQAAGPVIVTLLVDMVVTTSLCLALSRLGDAGAAGLALRGALRGVLSNPMPWAIALGALFSALQWELWAPLHKTVGLLADASSPVALFTIGAVLARAQMNEQAAPALPGAPEVQTRVVSRDYWGVAALKLVLHPLVVALLGGAAVSLGWLDKFALTVMVLVAALPSASNVSLLAERHGADNARVARIILVSTAMAFFTFSLLVHLLV